MNYTVYSLIKGFRKVWIKGVPYKKPLKEPLREPLRVRLRIPSNVCGFRVQAQGLGFRGQGLGFPVPLTVKGSFKDSLGFFQGSFKSEGTLKSESETGFLAGPHRQRREADASARRRGRGRRPPAPSRSGISGPHTPKPEVLTLNFPEPFKRFLNGFPSPLRDIRARKKHISKNKGAQ